MSNDMTNQNGPEEDFGALEPINNTQVAPATGIAALALNMAMKYHDIQMVKDGTLYQQYKLEGKNMPPLHLDEVFETAILIEMHLLGASERIAKIVVDAIAIGVEAEAEAEAAPESDGNATP